MATDTAAAPLDPLARKAAWREWLPLSSLLIFTAKLASLVVMATLSVHALNEREQAAGRASVASELGRRLDSMLSAVKDAESGQRGYLLSGNEAYLEPYRSARTDLPIELRRVRELLASDREQIAALDRVSRLAADKFDEMDQTIALRSGGDLAGAVAIVNTDRGKRTMDELRSVVVDLRARQERDRLNALAQRDEAAKRAFLVTLIGSGVLFLLMVWTVLNMSRWYRANLGEIRLRSGMASLSMRLSGDPGVEQLANDVLSFLAAYLDARVGAFWVLQAGRRLERVGAWGLESDARALPADGTTLLGQAVRDRRRLHLSELPEGYLPVTSGLGRGVSHEAVIVPALVGGQVLGAIELGFLRKLSAADLEFLDRSAEPLGIALRSARDRTRLEDLLAETQRQGEELQTQQEELRVSNEELEEQSRALKESQGRLEASQAELEANNSQLEEQTRLLEDQRDRLQVSQRELAQQALDLERASQYKSEFLANMSHELRTPLNSTLILARLLADNKPGNLTPEQVRYAETISSAGNDLLVLINDILDLSRIEAGKFDVTLEAVPVSRSLEAIRLAFAPMAQQKGLAFTVATEPDTPERLETDAQRLGQILRNLVGNAIKFTDAGQVSITVSAPRPGFVAFAVSDSGIGIAEHQQKLVFDAFQQASGGTNRRYGGTGLGLTISRDLARLLGGDITLQSREGEGSTFTLTLPVVAPEVPARDASPASPRAAEVAAMQAPRARGGTARQPAAPAAPHAPLPPPAPVESPVEDDRDHLRAGRPTILVVEDDPSFAGILRDLAHELDFQCIVEGSASRGLAAALEHQPSAIVLDVQLPDHSGLGVLDQLKRNPKTRHIPVHVASVADFSHEALELGAIGYALKPVKRDELVEAFRKLEARFSRLGQGRVLVVEDDERQLESLRQLLGNDEAEIVGVRTAQAALEELRARTFDCMVMDLDLPDLSGHELLEKMAEGDEHGFPPVIVYTGRTLGRDEEQRLRRHSRSVIVKGARSPERLLDEVTLFLHQVESKLPPERQRMLRVARDREQAFEGRRILVVEDDVRNVFALTSVLEPKGAQVLISRNGREALDALDRQESLREPVDLVLMDIMMPEMDGYTAMREIRKRPAWRRLPMIALTAKAMRDDQEKCLDAGANDYIAKPLDVEKLLSLIRVWLPK